MKKILFLIVSLAILLPTLLPLFRNGFFIVHDNTQVERVFQMSKSLSDGAFPVRWVDDLGYGYGYPIFNFYAPFPYYLGSAVDLIINDSVVATKIMFAIGIATSFFSMYILASSFTNRYGGLVAGVIYLYFPYHALNIYVRGAVGEFFAYVFLPLVFWAVFYIYRKTKLVKNNKPIIFESILLSIPLALVVVSHNLSAFMLSILLLPYVLFFLFRSKNKIVFISSILIMGLVAFLISSFYVLPAIFESGYTNVDSQIGGGAFYADHFVCLGQLWSSNWGFGGSALGCIDGISFALGRVNIFILLIALVFLIRSLVTRKKSYEIIFWILLLTSVFLLLPISKAIWDNLPFMEYLQFPWRFMNFVALFISLISAFLIFRIKNKHLVLAAVFLISIPSIYQNTKLFNPVVFSDYESNYYENIEHIRWDTSRISDEYMPKSFDKPKGKDNLPRELIETESVGVFITSKNNKTGYIEFDINGDGGVVHINKAYFPGWKAVDSHEEFIDIRETGDGMSLIVPKGEQKIILRIVSTPIQLIGNALSVIGILIVIIAIIAKKRKFYE